MVIVINIIANVQTVQYFMKAFIDLKGVPQYQVYSGVMMHLNEKQLYID